MTVTLIATETTENQHYAIMEHTGKAAGAVTREYGLTVDGIDIGGRWVYRNDQGDFISLHKYRNDLFDRHSITVKG